MKDNPEKVMLFIFPFVVLGLFVAAVLVWWLIQNLLQGNFAHLGH